MVCLPYNLLSAQSDVFSLSLWNKNSLLFEISVVVLTAMKNAHNDLYILKNENIYWEKEPFPCGHMEQRMHNLGRKYAFNFIHIFNLTS